LRKKKGKNIAEDHPTFGFNRLSDCEEED